MKNFLYLPTINQTHLTYVNVKQMESALSSIFEVHFAAHSFYLFRKVKIQLDNKINTASHVCFSSSAYL